MDAGRPYRAIWPGVEGDVLLVLSRSTRPRTGREVAGAAERSQDAVRKVLERFEEHGLVDAHRRGTAILYRLNRDHLLAPIVEEIANARLDLFERIRSFVASWDVQPGHLSVFGSMARGDGDTQSDVDILVVRPPGVDAEQHVWRSQLDELAEKIRRWTGNQAGITAVGPDDVALLRSSRPAIVDDLESDAIEIAGTSLRSLLREVGSR